MDRARCVFKVQGLDCAVEAEALSAALDNSPGVLGLGFDLIQGTMSVDFLPDQTQPATLARQVADRAGMQATVLGHAEVPASWWSRRARWITSGGSGLALGIGMIAGWSGASPSIARGLFALAILVGGVELFPKAFRALRQFRLDINVLMTLAALGALVLGYWDEAATVTFLFTLSEALEAASLQHARRAIRALFEVAPETAEVVAADGSTAEVATDRVSTGDRVRVRPGERVPVDGTVISGRSSVDQKAISGESVPVLREPGDSVFAGTVNGEGALDVEAAGPIGDALISRIIAQVQQAQANRAPIERRIERFARYYTPAVVGLSLGVMIIPPLVQNLLGSGAGAISWGGWFLRGLVVLVTACPCALVIATPVAVASGLAVAARRGILIKGGAFLEEFGRLRVLAFDKTGTLTQGVPAVVEVVSTGGAPDDLLRIAAALGDRGSHVLGRAIARHARGMSLNVPQADDYRAIPGLGAFGRVDSVEYHIGSHRYIDETGLCHPDFHSQLGRAEADVGTSVALTANTGPLGWIRLADPARPEAADILAELDALGVQTVMLTGDNLQTARAMARQLGINEQRAGLLPAEKVAALTELDARLGPVGMVGDGVNDAPALAAARVSVALGGISSGAALETADVVLMADDLSGIPWLIRKSRQTRARIQQNIALALGTKGLVLILAVLGYASLWMAIAADLGTSLVVILNALRLLRDSSQPARRRSEDLGERAGGRA